jgi:hypothetical protein
LTKLDDLREFVRNKSKKKDNSVNKKITEKEFSLEVAGSDATSNPLASFGDSETDPDLIDQVYGSIRNRVLRGENASYWDD